MVDSFISYLKYEKRLSEHTCSAYETDLAQFSLFIAEHFETKEIKEATYREIRSWVAELSKKGLSNTSINRKIACLKAFYGFLLRKRHISYNPMLKISSLKTPEKLPVYLEENATEILLDKLKWNDSFKDRRDQLILELFYASGIRLAELINLKVLDIDLFGSKMTVLGKRNKQRIIPLTGSVRLMISNYLAIRANEFHGDMPHLFLTDKGEKLYPIFVQRLVRKYLSMVSTKSKKSPHVLRHTFATHLLNKGADLNAIKELLGHASLSATQIYTHNSIEKLKAIHAQAHPKAG